MDNPKPKYYLTTPIYYANSRPHLGSASHHHRLRRHRSLQTHARLRRCLPDRHRTRYGVNIERAAEAAGITPQQLVDKNEKIFLRFVEAARESRLRISFKITSPEHERAVQTLVKRNTGARQEICRPEKCSIYKKPNTRAATASTTMLT